MAHFAVLAATEFSDKPRTQDQPDIECMAFVQALTRLEPYCLDTRNPKYLTFIDETEDARDNYENKCVDCIRLVDGRIIPYYDPEFYMLYELHEGKIYKHSFGPLHHYKRTARAKKMLVLPDYPLKKLYSSFEKFMEHDCNCTRNEETGQYGIYVNTNAKWDWFEVGGRWPLCFLVKKDCPLVVHGSPSCLFREPPQREAPEGFCWVAGARKCDIEWELMREDARVQYTQYFHEYEAWFQKGTLPKEKKSDLEIEEDGIVSRWGYVYHKNETLEAYLERMGVTDKYRYPFVTFACVDGDGWISMSNIRDLGAAPDHKDDYIWNKAVSDFIAKQPDETVLISVDCHT